MTDAEALRKLRETGGAEIMKASAGSGKTYSLSREYIRLLLTGNKKDGPHYHRHILAVTFTNKATESMKAKIVKDLDTIANDLASCGYVDYLKENCGFRTDDELKRAAKRALADILNDYSAFSVSTIDKFFQRTLKAFAREIGQTAEYKVELDKESLVNETVDAVLDSLSENDVELLRWLSDNSIEKIENGEGYKLESTLGQFARTYLSPEYEKKRQQHSIDESKAFTSENLRNLSKICRKIRSDFDEKIGLLGKDLDRDLRSIADCEKKVASAFLKIAAKLQCFDGNLKSLGTTWPKICADAKEGLKGDFKKNPDPAVLTMIETHLKAIQNQLGKPLLAYNTAQMLAGQIYVFRTAEALKKQYDSLLKEKNVLGIDDTNSILKEIIGGTDTPFIYEKTGTRYYHFLLDEFQDTSAIQWECFKPLLQNSIAEACYNLIVGDVKQSIYRWRDADWHILGNMVEQDLPRTVVNPLKTNWRSAENIVNFNNGFHRYVAGLLKKEDIYDEGMIQKYSEKVDVPGCVDVIFCDEDNTLAYVRNAIEEAQKRQFRLKDIAIIVRTHKLGGDVADYLSSSGINVITDDSLRVGSSPCVREVVCALSVLDDPEDAINGFNVNAFDLEALSDSRSVFEMADTLVKQLDTERVNAESLYVLAFMDIIRDYVANNGNALHSFLRYWREKGSDTMITCPKDVDAVTIITVHKSKGLDYPFVIVPFRGTESIYNAQRTRIWDVPDVADTPFSECEPALYNVQPSENTLFAEGYKREYEMSEVDYMNTWYVAMTRPEEELCIIAPSPSDKRPVVKYLHTFVTSGSLDFKEKQKYEDIALDVEQTVLSRFVLGEEAQKLQKRSQDLSETVELPYVFSLDDGRRGKVRISSDAAEYFLGEGEESVRKRGIVLHGIMQDIDKPEDLHAAVDKAVREGRLDSDRAAAVEKTLCDAIEAESSRRWFSNETVLSERDVISASDEPRRPDRVVIKEDSIDIIDYKFGHPEKSYFSQVRRYMKLYSDMGYKNVHGFLWFVEDCNVIEVGR